MSSFEFKLKVMLQEGSREKARIAREAILNLLDKFDLIKIDLEGFNFTPSVADEIIGVLAEQLGPQKFKAKIRILNASESDQALMNHVIARRLKSLDSP